MGTNRIFWTCIVGRVKKASNPLRERREELGGYAYALRICKPKLYTRQMKKEEIFTMAMKKMISLALATCLALSLSVSVGAVEDEKNIN